MELITVDEEFLENYSFNEAKRAKDQSKYSIFREIEDYTVDDIMLVRTTSMFPLNGVVETLAHSVLIEETENSYFSNALREAGIKEEETPVSRRHRSTVHFCLNALVGNHTMGNFTGRNIFVFDKLKHHLGDTVEGISTVDTYFNDDVYLSPEDSMIMLTKEGYENLEEEEKASLDKFGKVYVIDVPEEYILKKFNPEESSLYESAGNRQYFFEQLAVRAVLADNNVPQFIASSNYYVHEGTSYDDYQMTDVIRALAKEYKAGGHFGSEMWANDSQIDEERVQDSYYEHFNFLLSKAEPTDPTKKEEFDKTKERLKLFGEIVKERSYSPWTQNYNSSLGYLDGETFKQETKKFIEMIGEDQYKKLTAEFNEQKREQIKNEAKSK